MLNKLFAAAFLAAVSSGCILYSDDTHYDPDDYALPGDVTFAWRLAGGLCSDDPSVKAIYISVPGEYLANDGVYPCSTGGFQGIVLHDFEPGDYSFTIEAVDYWNEPVYFGEGTFFVDGDTRIIVDLTPAGSPTSYGYLSWDFPATSASSYPNCTQAGVAYVDVSYDHGAPIRYSCTAGFGANAVQTPYLMAGTHSVDITAADSTGYVFYAYSGTLTTYSGAPVSADYSLNWAVGGTAIRWNLVAGSTSKTCATADIQTMRLHFQDSSGEYIYGAGGDVQACDSAPVVYNYLAPGTYRVYIEGFGPGGTYLSSTAYPVTVTVKAGQFVTAAQATTVTLYKQ